MQRSTKMLITFAIVLGGIGFLAFQSMGDVEYYVHVEDVVKDPAKWLEKKTIQVHGFAHRVPTEPSMKDNQSFRRFELESKGQIIDVEHSGGVPDTFKDEAETVVKGQLTRQENGRLLLVTVGGEQGIMAKCPSKYAAGNK